MDVRRVDVKAAVARMERAVTEAGALLDVDTRLMASAGAVVIKAIAEERAAEGLQIGSVTKYAVPPPGSRGKQVSHNGLRDQFGPEWDMVCDLAVRLTVPLSPAYRRVRAESLQSLPVRVRDTNNGLGTDHIAGATPSMRFLALSGIELDRAPVARSIPYTVGTRDSAASQRYDAERGAKFNAEMRASGYGAEVPATMADHVQALCERRRHLIQRLEAMRGQGRVDDNLVDRVLRLCFSRDLVAMALPQGPADRRSTLYRTVDFFGDDIASLSVLEAHEFRVVARCGREATALAEEGFRRGDFEVVQATGSDLSVALLLDGHGGWGESWHWNNEQETLLKRVLSGRVEQFIAFRARGLNDDRGRAIALAKLEQEQWQRDCAERAAIDDGWGMLSVSSIASHAGMRGLLHVSEAALIATDRAVTGSG